MKKIILVFSLISFAFVFNADAGYYRTKSPITGRYQSTGRVNSMAVMTVGAIGLISTAMRTQKRNTVNEEVLQMVTGVRQLLGEYDDFSHLDNTTIFGAIGMSPKNPYGGTYELAVDPVNSKQFIVTINGLSKGDCEYFITKAWSDSVGYLSSNGRQGGASGNCLLEDGKNVIKIAYGE